MSDNLCCGPPKYDFRASLFLTHCVRRGRELRPHCINRTAKRSLLYNSHMHQLLLQQGFYCLKVKR